MNTLFRILVVVILVVFAACYIDWINERDDAMMRVMSCSGTGSAVQYQACVQELGSRQ